MRQHLVMGNWKLNGTKASVEALIKGLTRLLPLILPCKSPSARRLSFWVWLSS